jgi:hypothetical protein
MKKMPEENREENDYLEKLNVNKDCHIPSDLQMTGALTARVLVKRHCYEHHAGHLADFYSECC